MSDCLVDDARIHIFDLVDSWECWRGWMQVSTSFYLSSLDPKVRHRKYELTNFTMSLLNSGIELPGWPNMGLLAHNNDIKSPHIVWRGMEYAVPDFLLDNCNSKLEHLHNYPNAINSMMDNICEKSILDFDKVWESKYLYEFGIVSLFSNPGISPQRIIQEYKRAEGKLDGHLLIVNGRIEGFGKYCLDRTMLIFAGLSGNPNLTIDDVIEMIPYGCNNNPSISDICFTKNRITGDDVLAHPEISWEYRDGMISSGKIKATHAMKMIEMGHPKLCNIIQRIDILIKHDPDINVAQFLAMLKFKSDTCERFNLCTSFVMNAKITVDDLAVLLEGSPENDRNGIVYNCCSNPSLNPYDLVTLPYQHSFHGLSRNASITEKFITTYGIQKFSLNFLSSNPGISIDYILADKKLKWNRARVSMRKDLRMNHVLAHPDFGWDYDELSHNRHAVTYDDIIANPQLPWNIVVLSGKI